MKSQAKTTLAFALASTIGTMATVVPQASAQEVQEVQDRVRLQVNCVNGDPATEVPLQGRLTRFVFFRGNGDVLKNVTGPLPLTCDNDELTEGRGLRDAVSINLPARARAFEYRVVAREIEEPPRSRTVCTGRVDFRRSLGDLPNNTDQTIAKFLTRCDLGDGYRTVFRVTPFQRPAAE